MTLEPLQDGETCFKVDRSGHILSEEGFNKIANDAKVKKTTCLCPNCRFYRITAVSSSPDETHTKVKDTVEEKILPDREVPAAVRRSAAPRRARAAAPVAKSGIINNIKKNWKVFILGIILLSLGIFLTFMPIFFGWATLVGAIVVPIILLSLLGFIVTVGGFGLTAKSCMS